MDESSETATIYGLYDPRDNALRYIGLTTLRLKTRLAAHIGDRHNVFADKAKSEWVLSLLAAGVKPAIKCLEVCSAPDRYAREVEWVRKSLAEGHDLLNSRFVKEASKHVRDEAFYEWLRYKRYRVHAEQKKWPAMDWETWQKVVLGSDGRYYYRLMG